ncbi:hypothetical protein KUTeg_009729 [Tegillarca granosa]|uniref:Uncharacterized protein n=1 Tax=Tegillarca granosa TaxID=220873 RepID=A0ABQ9F812_TEGGR|nr:hypothetical protein KUTeg_009729 [Tegillarca granosa]
MIYLYKTSYFQDNHLIFSLYPTPHSNTAMSDSKKKVDENDKKGKLFHEQQQRLKLMGKTGSSDASKMIESMFGSTEKPKPKQQTADLVSMMFECSDLSAPNKAKTFHKPSLKEIHAKHPVHAAPVTTVHENQQVHQMHLMEQARMAAVSQRRRRKSSGSGRHDSLNDGKISTERLYPILLLSGLPKESLDDFGDFHVTPPVKSTKIEYVYQVPKPSDEKMEEYLAQDYDHSNVRNFFGSDDSSDS